MLAAPVAAPAPGRICATAPTPAPIHFSRANPELSKAVGLIFSKSRRTGLLARWLSLGTVKNAPSVFFM